MNSCNPANDSAVPPEGDVSRNEEFVSLYSEHQRELFKFIFLLVPRHADAEDILQDTSVVLWNKFDDFQSGTDFFRWAAQVARFKVLEYHKKAGRDRHRFWQDDLIDAIAETRLSNQEEIAEQRVLLVQCVRKLAILDRKLLLLCFRRKQTIKAVAEFLGRPVNTLYKALNRIRKSLLDCIEKSR